MHVGIRRAPLGVNWTRVWSAPVVLLQLLTNCNRAVSAIKSEILGSLFPYTFSLMRLTPVSLEINI